MAVNCLAAGRPAATLDLDLPSSSRRIPMFHHRPALAAAALAVLAGSAIAQSTRAYRVLTDASGTYLIRNEAPACRPHGTGGADTVLWTYLEPIAIPESCALAPLNDSAWVGEQLNNERLQRFAISGNGTPTFEVSGHHALFNPAVVTAAAGADLAVFLDQVAQSGSFILTAYHSDSATPAWTFNIPENYIGSDTHN